MHFHVTNRIILLREGRCSRSQTSRVPVFVLCIRSGYVANSVSAESRTLNNFLLCSFVSNNSPIHFLHFPKVYQPLKQQKSTSKTGHNAHSLPHNPRHLPPRHGPNNLLTPPTRPQRRRTPEAPTHSNKLLSAQIRRLLLRYRRQMVRFELRMRIDDGSWRFQVLGPK